MPVSVVFKDGKCEEALNYYCKVFNIDFPDNIIRYEEFNEYQYPLDIRHRIFLSKVNILGTNIYFSDAANDNIIDYGNNVSIVVNTDEENLYNYHYMLKEDSFVIFEPQKRKNLLFTKIIDKFNVSWIFVAKI